MERGRWLLMMMVMLCVPAITFGQDTATEIKGLQQVLNNLYKELLPLCGELRDVGRALAGFAAIFYIGNRVWRAIAAAEPVDFYPLFRPFATGMAIMLFPSLLHTFNSVLEPTVAGTSALVKNSNKAVEELLKQKEAEIKKSKKWEALVGATGEGDRDVWMRYYHPSEVNDEGIFGKIGNDVEFALAKMSYNFRNSIKKVIATILQILYEAAALCVNTLRIFKLIILAIIGPLVLGLSVFDGFHHTLQVYLARYINVFLWLPICNILSALLGKIQENMIKLDLSQIANAGDTFFSSYDLGYIIFMIIGIICFTTVPSIADEIVFVGGGIGMQSKVTQMFSNARNTVTYGTYSTASGMAGDIYSDIRSNMAGGMARSSSGDYFSDANSSMRGRISGK
ncbi:conjugative transposon protein TraJ [Niastella sp. OAS944]|uniref:conjugative transposon protein TraJ n=1 Tax=Niastella sp. OAS944 TaxID=2664089 RepID=UPI00348005D8|nr:conjugative transposon TraJ protein [Chitinophagaceae bacterium OAS944]